jgi:hypothetical protein
MILKHIWINLINFFNVVFFIIYTLIITDYIVKINIRNNIMIQIIIMQILIDLDRIKIDLCMNIVIENSLNSLQLSIK